MNNEAGELGPHDRARTLPMALARRAAHHPTSMAVTDPRADGCPSLSYAELVGGVARLASHLVRAGVGSGGRVVIAAAKSIDTFVAIHAAQWAGAVAVPVDAGAPAHTLRTIIDDTEPEAIVIDRAVAARLATGGSDAYGATLERCVRTTVGIDVVPEAFPGAITFADAAAADPIDPICRSSDDPAYILYTSGSTGRPKGIVHSHSSGLRYAELAAAAYDLGPHDRMASIAPFHFDQSTFELYASAVSGASVVLVPAVLLAFPAEVAALVAQARATTWYSVPTLLIHLLERGAIEDHDLSALRWVLFGGEVFPTDKLAALMHLLPKARFSNVYGPTEVNQCTFHHLDAPPAPGAEIPIGVPWDDTDIRVVPVDAARPTGSATEWTPAEGVLDVRTSTMMLGYWRRDDLTAAAVASEVGADGAERRWYRTGDVVRRDADGLLYFVGRVDRQVKVRGTRIELEGVEAVLSDAPGVGRGAAVVTERSGENVLYGVVEPSSPSDDVDGRAVLMYARRHLPAASVPNDVVVVPHLALTATGKVDARAAEADVELHLGDRRADGAEKAPAERVEERKECG